MADEQESVAQVEVPDNEAPLETAQAEDQTVDLEEQRLALLDGEEEAPQPGTAEATAEEFDDIDFDGKKYQVPKALKAGFMMQADYTQKTQAVSARMKELDARETRITQQSEATEAELDMRSDLRSVEKRIKDGNYATATREQWQQWSAEDPLAAQDGWREYQLLLQEKQQLTEKLQQEQNTRSEKAKQDTATRLQETAEFARKQPGWTPEVEQNVLNFAKDNGLTVEFIRENITPAYYNILYKAMLGDQALRKPVAPKPTPPVTPLKVVGAKQNAPVAKSVYDPDISMADYDAMRSKQEAARRARGSR